MNKIDTLFNNPYYWNNNKRRLHGLKPIRNNKKRINQILHSQELFNAIEEEIDKQYEQEIIKQFDNFATIRNIPWGDKL